MSDQNSEDDVFNILEVDDFVLSEILSHLATPRVFSDSLTTLALEEGSPILHVSPSLFARAFYALPNALISLPFSNPIDPISRRLARLDYLTAVRLRFLFLRRYESLFQQVMANPSLRLSVAFDPFIPPSDCLAFWPRDILKRIRILELPCPEALRSALLFFRQGPSTEALDMVTVAAPVPGYSYTIGPHENDDNDAVASALPVPCLSLSAPHSDLSLIAPALPSLLARLENLDLRVGPAPSALTQPLPSASPSPSTQLFDFLKAPHTAAALRSVSLHGPALSLADAPSLLADHCPRLASLTLDVSCSRGEPLFPWLAPIPERLTSLTALTLDVAGPGAAYTLDLEFAGLLALDRLSLLRSLSLSRCSELTNVLRPDGPLPHLTSLSLQNCTGSADFCKAVAPGLPCLASLTVFPLVARNVKNPGPTVYAALSTLPKSLRSLRVALYDASSTSTVPTVNLAAHERLETLEVRFDSPSAPMNPAFALPRGLRALSVYSVLLSREEVLSRVDPLPKGLRDLTICFAPKHHHTSQAWHKYGRCACPSSYASLFTSLQSLRSVRLGGYLLPTVDLDFLPKLLINTPSLRVFEVIVADFEVAHSLVHYASLRERLTEHSLAGRPVRWRVVQHRSPANLLHQPVDLTADGWSQDLRKPAVTPADATSVDRSPAGGGGDGPGGGSSSGSAAGGLKLKAIGRCRPEDGTGGRAAPAMLPRGEHEPAEGVFLNRYF